MLKNSQKNPQAIGNVKVLVKQNLYCIYPLQSLRYRTVFSEKMSGGLIVLLFTWHVILMIEIDIVYAKCTSNSNCRNNPFHKVCCAKALTESGCFQRSCVGEFCTSDGDCGGKGECCKFNKCTTDNCPECKSHSHCGPFLYCCQHRFSFEHNVCRRSCIGETCHSDSDCAVPLNNYCLTSKTCWAPGLHCLSNSQCKGDGECCKSGVCVTTDCPCNSDSDCGSSQYCCKEGTLGLSSICRSSCVGKYCRNDGNCGPPDEYCNLNTKKCGKKTCNSDFDCGSSRYCCRHGTFGLSTICRSSCVGKYCRNDGNCGPPDEYCNLNTKKCGKKTCNSDFDCGSSRYCCRHGTFGLSTICRSSCVGKYCRNDGNCGPPDEYCNLNTKKCGKKTCNSDFDCGSSRYCCRHGTFGMSTICRSSCVEEYCASDDDCGPSDEHCNLDAKKCTNDTSLARWLIAVIVVSVLVFVFVFIGGWIYCYCCSGSPWRRRRVVREPAPQSNAATISLRGREIPSAPRTTASNNPPLVYVNQGQDCLPRPTAPPKLDFLPEQGFPTADISTSDSPFSFALNDGLQLGEEFCSFLTGES